MYREVVRDGVDRKRREDVHGLLAPDNLDGDLADLTRIGLKYTRSDDIREHALAERREDLVPPTVQLLA